MKLTVFVLHTIYPTQSNHGSWDNVGTMSVPIRHFVSLHRLQMGILGFSTEIDLNQKSGYGNSSTGVILFLLWCTFVVPSFKNTASIFQQILSVQYFIILSCKQCDIITTVICIIKNVKYSLKWKHIFQKENYHSSV